MRMKSFYPKRNWVKWKSIITESVENLVKGAFEKTVNKSWQNRWEINANFALDIYEKTLINGVYTLFIRVFCGKVKV